jgi:hypothetical protein
MHNYKNESNIRYKYVLFEKFKNLNFFNINFIK